jgi:hypothetical protein
MTRLPADLVAVAAVNPVPYREVAGQRASAKARELRARLLNSTADDARRIRRPSRRFVALGLAVLAAVTVGTAIAARLMTAGEVERFLPQGSLVFAGAQPHCTAVEAGVEYRCRLARTPTGMTVTGADGRPAFKGAKFGTLGDDGRINGGCVALDNPGTEWACYVGERAVAQGILDEGVLGQKQSGPTGG